MKYVSAEYIPPMEGMPGPGNIKAVGDDGNEYWIPNPHTDVPPWPEFCEENPEIADELKGHYSENNFGGLTP